MNKTKIIFLLFVVFQHIESFSIDSLFITDSKKELNIIRYIYILEDPKSSFNIDSLQNFPQKFSFYKNNETKLNFGFNTSTYWIKFVIKNNSDIPVDYILSVSNPDLNYIDFYEYTENQISKAIHTGEFRDVSSREVYHRNFIFNIDLNPEKVKTYYLSFNNNGGPLFMPIALKEREDFNKTDNTTELIYWSIYGLLLFIVVFNIYLNRSTKDKVSLYYSLYVLFALLFFFCYDGYFYFFNPPVVIEKFKFFYPGLYNVFLLSFTQAFAGENPNFRGFKKFLNPLKIIALVAASFFMLPYPFSLMAEIGVPLLILSTLILIITIAIATLNLKYSPSIWLLVAYVIVFLGLTIHELKEFDILPPVFFVVNASKFGLTLECIVLTIAVLERFRINQKNAKETIHESYLRIEGQNQELEIINTELEKLSIVASETNNSVAIYDKKGRLEWCNSGFERFYGFNLGELIANQMDHIENIVPNKDIKDFFETCLNKKTPISFETKVVVKNNVEKWGQTTLTPYPRSGKVTKIIAIDSDITDLKNYGIKLELAKEKAIESDRLKTVFLGNMSHEIRTPLNGILGFTELLGRTQVSDDKKEKFYKLIKSNGDQLIRIIDDIVDISIIESNQLKIDEVEFDLNILMNEVVDFFEIHKSNVSKTHINLIVQNEIRYFPFFLYTDPIRLKQILMNLLKNSFKFTSEGYVRLECIANKEFIHVTVEDTGIGIDPEKAKIVFDRFRQGDETLSRKYGGTGLGLSISKGIVEKMGGRIWIDSTYQTGLRICFEIPNTSKSITGNVLAADYTTDQMAKILKEKNILIVEDDDTSYELLTEMLSPFEINLSRAINGVQAIKLATEGTFDAVLMDINLPVLDGVAATKEIRKFNNNLIIIAQTAYAMEIEKENILASGCNDIVCKPIKTQELFDKITFHFTKKQIVI